MNALVPVMPIPLPSNPARLPSLPAWLQQRSAALASAVQADSSGQHREMPILPKEMILSSSERSEVQRHIHELARFTRLDQTILLREVTMSNDAAIATMIAQLLIKGDGARLDKASSDALTEDYLDALEDLPAWCVREAIRKWNRGESAPLEGKKHDFNWRPKPPALRRLAQHELAGVKGRIISLLRLCEAVPLVEFSDEHREKMLNRVRDLIRGATQPAPMQEAGE